MSDMGWLRMEVWTFAPEVMNCLMALSVIFFGASVALYFKDGQEFTRPVMVMLIFLYVNMLLLCAV